MALTAFCKQRRCHLYPLKLIWKGWSIFDTQPKFYFKFHSFSVLNWTKSTLNLIFNSETKSSRRRRRLGPPRNRRQRRRASLRNRRRRRGAPTRNQRLGPDAFGPSSGQFRPDSSGHISKLWQSEVSDQLRLRTEQKTVWYHYRLLPIHSNQSDC